MFDLTGKRALVTGASGGIGREIAKALAQAGARVALSGTRVAALEDTAKELGGGEHPILPCNLSNLDAVDKLVPAAEAALGGLDILVNNAGMTRDNLFMRMKNEEWDEVLAVNLTAAFHLTRAVLRGMMKQRFGR
ncbi:MAG: SDR family NAD(P)-dependent oxidoreductase, partial [Pseudoxanthomonas sp.]